MEQRYITSKYNVIKKDETNTFVFNTLTSGFVKVSTKYWNDVRTSEIKGGIGAELVNESLVKTGIFVRSDVDELQLYKYFYYNVVFQNNSFALAIAPTMKCNFGCFYCFEEGNKNAGVMKQEIADNLVKYITLQKNKNVFITWFGGEPLLGFERIVYICEELKKNNVSYTSNMISNGSLLTESVIKKLSLLNLKSIQISLDGLKEEHDKRRIFKNGAPSFDLIVHNIENLLRETNVRVIVKVTVDHTNASAFGDVRRYFREHYESFVDKGQLLVVSNFVKDRTGFDKNGSCFNSVDELKEQIKSFESSSDVCEKPRLPGLARPCMFRCQTQLAVDSQGYIYRCLENLGVPATKVGDLCTGKMSSARMAQTTFQDDPFENAECKSCSYLPICGGGCPVVRRQKMAGKKIECCTSFKNNLAELLPYFYKHKQFKLSR